MSRCIIELHENLRKIDNLIIKTIERKANGDNNLEIYLKVLNDYRSETIHQIINI